MAYEVFSYSIPKVSPDGKKSLPGPESKMQEFVDLEGARRFAADQNEKYDRVIVINNSDDGRLVERYLDGVQG